MNLESRLITNLLIAEPFVNVKENLAQFYDKDEKKLMGRLFGITSHRVHHEHVHNIIVCCGWLRADIQQ